MVAPTHITAPTAAELEEIRKVFSEGRGALQIIKGDLGRWRRWAFRAASVALMLGVCVAEDRLIHQPHDLAIKRAAYAAGQVDGACRMWREALSRDPILAFPRSSGRLDHACAPVLTAAR